MALKAMVMSGYERIDRRDGVTLLIADLARQSRDGFAPTELGQQFVEPLFSEVYPP